MNASRTLYVRRLKGLWCTVRVDPGWWEVFGDAVGGEPDVPVSPVELPMMMWAKKHAVVVAGRSALRPVLHVVRVAPRRGPVAAGEGASAVPDGDGPADRGREQPDRGAHVQHLGPGAEDRGDDHRIAGQHPCLRGGDRPAVVQQRGTEFPAERVEVHGDGDVRSFPALGGREPDIQEPAEYLDEGLAAADIRRPRIRGAVDGGSGLSLIHI